jgi:adenylate cyclase
MDAPPTWEIRDQLERIASSGVFSGSERLRRFLTWTVEQSLDGHAENIKGYTIGREVFDRGENFDPRIDSIVRTEAQRLRRKLAEYYKTEGRSDPILISFEPGRYVPSFRLRSGERPELVSMHSGERHGVAVCPFVNLTGDPEQEHFCRGIGATIQERLLARHIEVFSVHPPLRDWFSYDFVQQANDLGVEQIITGGVEETENSVRVHVRVIDAASGTYILARSFDRAKVDPWKINDEIAEAIAEELKHI